MVTLRACMRAHLVDWQNDLDQDWQAFFAGCPELDFAAIPEDIQVADETAVWPGRRNAVHPDAPEASHICRAFADTAPQHVRLVVLGQDPYPAIGRATGRAFEDGAWDGRPQGLAISLKGLILAALATREGHAHIFRAGQWPTVRRQIEQDGLVLPALENYFDGLARQGVLFVNAAWTHTRPSDVPAQLDLWNPARKHFLSNLAEQDQPVVFLLLGEEAVKAFVDVEPLCNRSIIVVHAHPRSHQFFNCGQNPLVRVNLGLERLGAEPIQWWPPLVPV